MTARARLDGDQLIATRHVSVDSELVWLAFTTPQHLAEFWGGHHATVLPGSVSVDVRVGGRFELEVQGGDGTTRRLRFRYEVVEPPTHLRLSEPLTGITTDIRFETIDAGTRVVVHQRRLPPELRSDVATAGLAGVLERLDAVLQTIRDL